MSESEGKAGKVKGERNPNFGVLTDEGIARLRTKIGIPQPKPTPPHNLEVTRDGTRHFAAGYGDDNPLWSDPEYGRNTRWGGLIAPPNFNYTMGEDGAPKLTPEQKATLKGDPLAGLGSYQAVMEFEFEEEDREVMRGLAEKARAGRLTADDERAIEAFTRVGALLSIIKLKARLTLAKKPARRKAAKSA